MGVGWGNEWLSLKKANKCIRALLLSDQVKIPSWKKEALLCFHYKYQQSISSEKALFLFAPQWWVHCVGFHLNADVLFTLSSEEEGKGEKYCPISVQIMSPQRDLWRAEKEEEGKLWEWRKNCLLPKKTLFVYVYVAASSVVSSKGPTSATKEQEKRILESILPPDLRHLVRGGSPGMIQVLLISIRIVWTDPKCI